MSGKPGTLPVARRTYDRLKRQLETAQRWNAEDVETLATLRKDLKDRDHHIESQDELITVLREQTTNAQNDAAIWKSAFEKAQRDAEDWRQVAKALSTG